MAVESKANHPVRNEAGVRHLLQELNREDSRLRSHMLDAAIAGLRLSRNPHSLELRGDVAKLWSSIEPVLSHHLDTEDTQILPWLKEQKKISAKTLSKIRESHSGLRELMSAVASREPGTITVEEARQIGKALTALSVALDDMIDDEERRLLPTLRRVLFESLH